MKFVTERLERNWRRQKGKWPEKRKMMEMIKKEEKIKQEKLGVRRQTEKDNNEMGNIVDPYYEL